MLAPEKSTHSLHAFLAELQTEQQQLDTPVARFAALHSAGAFQRAVPVPQLIPLTAPGPGEQYAFEVDLDSCSGCKACVSACHSLNGLDETESWRDVGFVVGGTTAAPFHQTITTACHHCVEPGCLHGCPVLAYEKDPTTGIVRHLDDQCIGCSYCVLKCPYDVPKFNDRLGIVRKCDMCHGRLAEGEAPACAQACPTHAIKIVTVSVAENVAVSALGEGLPAGAPDSRITQPTTRYKTKRTLPENLRAADADVLRPQHPHWALIFLLVGTQAGYGLFAAQLLSTSFTLRVASLVLIALGLFASVAHLGQPLRAWRVFLGLRRSWLSREAVLLGASVGILALGLAVESLAALEAFSKFARPLLVAGWIVGLLGVFSSVMIYVDTKRSFWRFTQSAGRMFGTLGGATALSLTWLHPEKPALLIGAAAVLLSKLALEAATLLGSSHPARLQREILSGVVRLRFGLGLSATAMLAGFSWQPMIVGLLGFFLWLGGELCERYLYFRAVDAPKMPGHL